MKQIELNKDTSRDIRNQFKNEIEALDLIQNEEINTKDIPEITNFNDFESLVKLLEPESKTQITLRLDNYVVDWFKNQGKGYQSKMNAILKAFIEHQKYKA